VEVTELELESYVEAIEAHFRARRGAEHILSPRDFQVARAWHQAGVPLATVLVGIDRAFEADPKVSSLSFCRRRVQELVSAGPRFRSARAPAAGGGGERLSQSDLLEVLGLLRERLAALPAATRAGFAMVTRRIEEIEDLLAVASRPNWEYVRDKLHEIDEEVSAAAVDSLTVEDRAAVRAEAGRAAERHRGRVDAASLEDAMARYTVQRARERLQLPRVGTA
jgi:hypothetical protein